jgi:uncharacterized protein YodC (DUF2158 family)
VESSIEVGVVVVLKSGGPQMTVARVFEGSVPPCVTCQWFVGGDAREGLFPAASLAPQVPPETPPT